MSYNRSNAGAAALGFAEKFLGVPYVFGGESAKGFDCSGLAQFVYGEVGVPIARTTYDQCGEEVVGGAWEPGDLGFIMGSDPMLGKPGHVGIYVGVGVISGATQHTFTPSATGRQVFVNAPFTGDLGGVRYDYFNGIVAHTRPALALPNPPAPKPPVPAGWPKIKPTAAQLKQCNLVVVANAADGAKYMKAGWNLWYWGNDGKPHVQLNGKPTGCPLYVNANALKAHLALSFSTAQDQVGADITQMQAARVALNTTDTTLKAGTSATLYKKLHTSIATTSGILQGAIANAQAWLTANPAPAPAPTPDPTPAPTPTPTPTGPTPNAPVAVGELLFEETFQGTSLDPAKWAPNWFGEGNSMNNVKCYKANVSVANGACVLTLASTSSGALISTNPHGGANPGFQFGSGVYIEWDASLPSTAWAALWTDGQSWPANGETDIVEVLDGGKPTSNYHATSDTDNGPDEPTSWLNSRHTFGCVRNATTNDIWWDQTHIRSETTHDGGAQQYLIANVGQEGGEATPGSQLTIHGVRVWALA